MSFQPLTGISEGASADRPRSGSSGMSLALGAGSPDKTPTRYPTAKSKNDSAIAQSLDCGPREKVFFNVSEAGIWGARPCGAAYLHLASGSIARDRDGRDATIHPTATSAAAPTSIPVTGSLASLPALRPFVRRRRAAGSAKDRFRPSICRSGRGNGGFRRFSNDCPESTAATPTTRKKPPTLANAILTP